MSSSILNGVIHYFIIFHSHSLFSLHRKIFGCTCFVFDIRSQLTKLDPKSLKCVFLCYSHTQKGCRCFSPYLGHYLISVDIPFFEDRPFFAFFAESQLSLPVGESNDSFLTYTIIHCVPPTPIATGIKFSEKTYFRCPQVSRKDIPEDTQPLPLPVSANSANDLPIVL